MIYNFLAPPWGRGWGEVKKKRDWFFWKEIVNAFAFSELPYF